jgi:transcriptional regulator with XRE-family HTH domain
MADDRDEDEGRKLARTWQNRMAGRVLRAARANAGTDGENQAEFAARLGRATRTSVSISTLSNWETGRRTVPGPMLIEAAIATGGSLDALLASAGEDEPATAAWAAKRTFPARVRELEQELRQQAALLATMLKALEERGIVVEQDDPQPGHQATATER